MKFLADMGISPRSVAFLRDLGYEGGYLWRDRRAHSCQDTSH
jgi:hypothetical protein